MLVLSLLSPAASAADVLPVHRIRFYETGVAWFERRGTVSAATSLPVPTSHLDDALKTLVVLGGDVDLGAITFPTAVGDDAARVRAGLPDSDQMGFAASLKALLGVQVALTIASGRLEGVLVDVQGPLEVARAEHPTNTVSLAPQFALTVLGADGSLHRTTTDQVEAVHSDEADVTRRLATAARTLARTRAQRASALDVQLAKGGELGLGYLAEAPVWRVSYRILADAGRDADLQAWALVHNDTDEAWSGVSIELANGEPDSFLFPLAAPRYAERALETPDRELATISQLATSTPDEMWNRSGTGAGGLGMTGYGSGGGGASFGTGGIGSGRSVATALKTAEPVQTPTQFVYRVGRPVDLPAHHSALVPIVQQGVPAEPAVVFEPGSNLARSGMWLANGTQRTLPAGVVSVLQSGGLAGEARLERLKPDETQMLTFGNELDLDLERTTTAGEPEPTELWLHRGALKLTSTKQTTRELAVRNRSGRDRTLWVALKLAPDQQVLDGVRTEIDRHTGWTWAVIDVAPGEQDRVVRTSSERTETRDPATVPVQTWEAWAELGLADAGALASAKRIRQQLDDLDARSAALAEERARAGTELEGLRASLAAADGSSGATPLTRRAASVEAEVRRLDGRAAALAEERAGLVALQLEALAPLGRDGAASAG